jgi:hypothetical protein
MLPHRGPGYQLLSAVSHIPGRGERHRGRGAASDPPKSSVPAGTDRTGGPRRALWTTRRPVDNLATASGPGTSATAGTHPKAAHPCRQPDHGLRPPGGLQSRSRSSRSFVACPLAGWPGVVSGTLFEVGCPERRVEDIAGVMKGAFRTIGMS